MTFRKISPAAATAVFCLFAFSAAFAQWIPDGVQVTSDAASQIQPCFVPDDEGGVFVAWADMRNGNWDIYTQHYDRDGNALLAAGGVPVCTEAETQWMPQICTDGSGGAFVAWLDFRPITSADIYAQRLDPSGMPQWTAGGRHVCNADDHQYNFHIAYDGFGCMVAAWVDRRHSPYEIRAQRMNTDAALQWAEDALLGYPSNDLRNVRVVVHPGATVRSSRVSVVYDSYASLEFETYLQRLTLDGAVLWGKHGNLLCSGGGNDQVRDMLATGAAGTIISWCNSVAGVFHAYLQSYDSLGSPLWGTSRLDAGAMTYYEDIAPTMAGDGSGGCYVTAGAGVHHVDAAGTLIDLDDLIDVPGTGASDGCPVVLADGCVAVLFQKDDGADHSFEKNHLQKFDVASRLRLWGDGGAPLTSLAIEDFPDRPLVIGDYIWATWSDARNGNNDVFLLRYDQNNAFYYAAEPVIESVTDVPADEGGWVRLGVRASDWEEIPEAPASVIYYNSWRRIAPTAKSSGAITSPDDDRLLLLQDAESSAGLAVTGAAAALLGLPDGDWESLGMHPALLEPRYTFLVPTRTDSTDGNLPREVYCVTAHAPEPGTYFASAPDSGYSVDNLAPGIPLGLTGAASYSPEGLDLAWNPVVAADLACYRVHRASDPLFAPAPENLAATVTAAGWFDAEWSAGSDLVYKVAACDRHGNVGEFAVLVPEGVTGVGGAVPGRARLMQNSPNPFNPSTTIRFRLPATAQVELCVYDLSGRPVRRLLAGESRTAGGHAVVWDGRDDRGLPVASGSYVYRLVAGDFSRARLMSLVR